MNQLFEIITINQSTTIVVSKTYLGLGIFISELEEELSQRKFKGEIVFDLLLSNGINSKNRFMHSCCNGKTIFEPELLNPIEISSDCKYYINSFYKLNPGILSKGILRKKEIETLEKSLAFI